MPATISLCRIGNRSVRHLAADSLAELDALTGLSAGLLAYVTGTSEAYQWDGAAWVLNSGPAGVTPRRVVGVTFDGNGSPPTVGAVGYLVCPFAGSIDQWHIVADASGSAVVDVWKAAGAIPTDANRIAGTEKPTLSAQQLASDVALSTWSTLSVAAGDVFGFELESVSTCTRLTVEIRISESA